jgi:hypothetical protein
MLKEQQESRKKFLSTSFLVSLWDLLLAKPNKKPEAKEPRKL